MNPKKCLPHSENLELSTIVLQEKKLPDFFQSYTFIRLYELTLMHVELAL